MRMRTCIPIVSLVISLIALASGVAAAPPATQIERGVFVDYGYSSPPWYTPAEETDTYRWAPRIKWASTSIPVSVTIYTEDQPVDGGANAIAAAFTAWDQATSAGLYSVSISSDSRPGVKLDGKNIVQWGAIDGPGGIVGATYYWYDKLTKEMVEFDIVLDKDEPWSTDGSQAAFDVQNVATHEVGHTLVLQDLRSPRDGALTMHAYTWWGDTAKRTLGQGDIRGIQAIYGQ